jgi:hypothetical protein
MHLVELVQRHPHLSCRFPNLTVAHLVSKTDKVIGKLLDSSCRISSYSILPVVCNENRLNSLTDDDTFLTLLYPYVKIFLETDIELKPLLFGRKCFCLLPWSPQISLRQRGGHRSKVSQPQLPQPRPQPYLSFQSQKSM